MNKIHNALDILFGAFALLLWVLVFSLWNPMEVEAAYWQQNTVVGDVVIVATPNAPERTPNMEELKLITEPVPPYEPEELYILAHLLCGEKQTGSVECQKAVGSVVLNRVNHRNYPDDIRSVVFQRGQYACTWDGNYDRTPTERNWEVADWLLRYGSIAPANVIYQAQFRQGSGVWKMIEGEVFCYE